MLEGDTREEVLEGEAREVVLDGDIMVEMFPLLERSWKTMELSKAQAAAGGQGSDLRKSGEEPGALGVTSAPAIPAIDILIHSGKDILHTGASTWLAAGPVAAYSTILSGKLEARFVGHRKLAILFIFTFILHFDYGYRPAGPRE